MTDNTTARTALRTAVASALIVIVTGLGAQTGWAADTPAPTAATATTQDGTTGDTAPTSPAGSGTDNNPWD